MAIRLNRRLVGNGYRLPVCRRLTQWKPGMGMGGMSGHREKAIREIALYMRL
jgi:hypothetical protein